MDRAYFINYYHLEREHWWFKVRSEIIINHCTQLLQGVKNPKILNIGVATGYLSEKLMALGEVESIEFDQTCYEFTKNLNKIKIVQGSILQLPFEDNVFDLVCAFDVIEHVNDDQKAIFEMNRVSRTAGKLIVTVPAFRSLWSSHDEINHHFRRYTQKQLISLVGEDNIVFCSYFNSILFIPVYLLKKIQNLISVFHKSGKPKNSNFDVIRSSLVNQVLEKIFRLEINPLKKQNTFPFGISLICSSRKLKHL